MNCPICKRKFAEIVSDPRFARRDGKAYCCAICGKFFMSRTAEVNLGSMNIDSRFSAWIREHEERELESPEISTYTIDNVLKNLPSYTPLEKQLILLRAIERRTDYPGDRATMNGWTDYTLAWAKNTQELGYLLWALEKRGYVLIEGDVEQESIVTIQPEGWEYLDQQFSQAVFLTQAFVAMSFDPALDPVWEAGIRPAIERAGYKAHRVDQEPHIDRIDAKIIADIKDSLFVVADVTQQKQGVYFEAGFAQGLNRPVIWTVREDDLSNVHFDTRQYSHILWTEPADLQEKLFNTICAVIGKRPPEKE
jgi:nucleoside 2-deoxyribosyltransferase